MNPKQKKQAVDMNYGSAKKRAESHDSGYGSRCISLPDGFSFFSLKKPGTYTIDILPYRVGKGNPIAEEGTLFYERTYYVHRNVGPNQETVICPARTWNKRCPICEARARMQKEPNVSKEALKLLNTSERQLFVVKEYPRPGEESKGFQIWDMSYFLFGKLLDARIKSSDTDDNFEHFFHLENGLKLKLTVGEMTMGAGKPFCKVDAIDFKMRKEGEQYKKSVIKELPCLDDLLKEMSFKEINKLFTAGEETEDDGEDDNDTSSDDEDGNVPNDEEDNDSELEESDDELEESEDEDGDGFEVGKKITVLHKKKKVKGLITKVNTKNEMMLVRIAEEQKPIAVSFEEARKANKTSPKAVDVDEDDDDFDDEDDSELDDEDFDDDGDLDDVEEEDDFQFDEDDDSEDDFEEFDDDEELRSKPTKKKAMKVKPKSRRA